MLIGGSSQTDDMVAGILVLIAVFILAWHIALPLLGIWLLIIGTRWLRKKIQIIRYQDGSFNFDFRKMNYSIDDYVMFMRKTGLFELMEKHIDICKESLGVVFNDFIQLILESGTFQERKVNLAGNIEQ